MVKVISLFSKPYLYVSKSPKIGGFRGRKSQFMTVPSIASSNRLPELLPLLKNVRKALERIAEGEVVEVIEIRLQ